MRLNKYLADAGVASRRQADALIAEGRVTVNGVRCQEMGMQCNPAFDIVAVDNKIVAYSEDKKEREYFLLHKPVQVMCTVRDPQNRKTIMDFLPEELKKKRLYPVGRLDYFSEGLLLMTNDGDLAYRLTHPKFEIAKVYHVYLRSCPRPEVLSLFRKGMQLAEGEWVKGIKVEVKQQGNFCVLEVTLKQGFNRQIRRMCRDTGLTILRLKRIQIGEIFLGNLQLGACRSFNSQEKTYIQSLEQKI